MAMRMFSRSVFIRSTNVARAPRRLSFLPVPASRSARVGFNGRTVYSGLVQVLSRKVCKHRVPSLQGFVGDRDILNY
jgi:hypothetical protein